MKCCKNVSFLLPCLKSLRISVLIFKPFTYKESWLNLSHSPTSHAPSRLPQLLEEPCSTNNPLKLPQIPPQKLQDQELKVIILGTNLHFTKITKEIFYANLDKN